MFFLSITITLSGALLSLSPLTLFVVSSANRPRIRAIIFHGAESLKYQIYIVCCCPFMDLPRSIGPHITAHYLVDVTF